MDVFNKNIKGYRTKENEGGKRGFSFSNKIIADNDEKKSNNFFNKIKQHKTKTGIDFFNPKIFGLYKDFQRNKNRKLEVNNKIKFPLIQQGKTIKIVKNFNNKIEQSFRKTATSFNFNNKLTIHDLK